MRPYSASHISLWNLCKRREAFAYRTDAPREPGGTAAEAGTRVHAVLETGKPAEVFGKYDVTRMAALIAAAAPAAANITEREQELSKELYGLAFTGRIDFQTETAVGDYKTTGKRVGVKSAATLENDPQRLMYVELTGKPDAIWLYGVWQDYSVHPVVVPGDQKRDREKFKLYVLTPAEEMAAVPADVDPLSLEPNVMACGAYYPEGCPYQSKCYDVSGVLRSFIAATTVAANSQENTVSILDTFKQPEETTGSVAVDTVLAQKEAKLRALAPPVVQQHDKPIGTLYIDAYPIVGVSAGVGGGVQHASELIAVASQSVKDDAHTLHALLIDFGKGAHMLAAQLAHDITTSGKRYEHLYLETRSAEGKAVLFELTGLAERVVRGMI